MISTKVNKIIKRNNVRIDNNIMWGLVVQKKEPGSLRGWNDTGDQRIKTVMMGSVEMWIRHLRDIKIKDFQIR